MTVPAMRGRISIAPQPEKVGEGSTISDKSWYSALTWYQFRAVRSGFAALQDQRVMPQEIGGNLTPNGAYKQMLFVGGDTDFYPRAENSLGWLLYALMGDVTSMPVAGETGVYDHTFKFASDGFTIPWLAARRFIPGSVTAENYGEIGFDCKVDTLRMTVPQMGLIQANVAIVGRDVKLAENPSFIYGNSLEDSRTIPLANNGYIKLGGTNMYLTGIQADFSNGLSDPRQEMVVGTSKPLDFVPLGRGCSFRTMVRWDGPDLLQKLLTNDAAGVDWSPDVYQVDTSGGTPALELFVKAGAELGTPATPYGVKMVANRVILRIGRPLELVAGSPIFQEIFIDVIEPSSGDYANITLRNGQTGYTWPSP